jgi:hypothetical protein
MLSDDSGRLGHSHIHTKLSKFGTKHPFLFFLVW